MKFKGDIIITDPCYIIKENSENDDWHRCDYGDNMEVLGINHYICKSTIYGDWSCTTFKTGNTDIKAILNSEDIDFIEPIGSFCADAGLVAVFSLDEILKYNPDFTKWMETHNWCVTLIKDFDGEVEYYVDDSDEAHIIGTGNINFFTTQTGV